MARTRKRKKLRIWPAMIGILLITAAIIGSYSYFSDKSIADRPAVVTQQDVKPVKPKNEKDADFKDVSLVLQGEIDKLLKEQKIENVLKEERNIAREGGGNIEWWQRQQLVYLDKNMSLEKFKNQLTNALKDKKGILYKQEKASYSGKNTERIDIAYVSSLGGETLTLIVDHLYVIAPSTPAKKLGSGKLAIIVDDCGYDTDTVGKMAGLNQDISFAIIPFRQYSLEALHTIRHSGKEALLHLPMEPLDASQQSEKTTVTVNMSDKDIRDFTKRAIEQLPGISGVNNHQGSRATADERVMKEVLSVIKSKKLFFVDSNTQPKTIAYKTARQMGIKTAINMAFLDGQADVAYIKARLRQAGETAIKNGSYIAICHARPKTVIALTEMVGELEAMGVEFVFVSALLH